MRVIRIDNRTPSDKVLAMIGSTPEGTKIMQRKMSLELFYIEGLRTPAANILKQDALSIGAELAVEKDTILCKEDRIDAVLIVNDKQRRILAKKELAQPFGLKKVARALASHRPIAYRRPQIMGVVNANDDSFFAGSRFRGAAAVEAIAAMIDAGAEIIDIGGVSSRPGSRPVPAEEELARIRPIVDTVAAEGLLSRARFSLDSYAPGPIAYALEKGFHIVNDITGLADDRVCKLSAEHGAQVVLMHMQNNPATMQIDPSYEHVIGDIDDFFAARLEKAARYGIEDLVLDVGIGFGKRLEENLKLIRHLGHFLHFGKPLLIGASRKSMIDMIVPTPVEERLAGTLTIHLKAVEEGASIVRCHDVKAHAQAFAVQEAMMETLI